MSSKVDLDRVRMALIHVIDSVENLREKNKGLDEQVRSEIDKNIEDIIESVEKICGIVKSEKKSDPKEEPSDS